MGRGWLMRRCWARHCWPARLPPPDPTPTAHHILAWPRQGEATMRIDENVEDTLANVDAGQAQLLKYLNTISSNRWLLMKARRGLVGGRGVEVGGG